MENNFYNGTNPANYSFVFLKAIKNKKENTLVIFYKMIIERGSLRKYFSFNYLSEFLMLLLYLVKKYCKNFIG